MNSKDIFSNENKLFSKKIYFIIYILFYIICFYVLTNGSIVFFIAK